MKSLFTVIMLCTITIATQAQMFGVNIGQRNFFSMSYAKENPGKVKWFAELQASDEIGVQLTGGYRLGSEMYNVSPGIGITQFVGIEDKLNLHYRSLTTSIRAQVWIFSFQVVKRVDQKALVSIGLRGNLTK